MGNRTASDRRPSLNIRRSSSTAQRLAFQVFRFEADFLSVLARDCRMQLFSNLCFFLRIAFGGQAPSMDQSGQHCYKTREHFLTGSLPCLPPKSSSSSAFSLRRGTDLASKKRTGIWL